MTPTSPPATKGVTEEMVQAYKGAYAAKMYQIYNTAQTGPFPIDVGDVATRAGVAAILEALSTPAAPELAVKDGWVMVPKEPTPHMMAKAFDAVEINNAPGFATGNHARRAIWDAMIAASPQQGEKP